MDFEFNDQQRMRHDTLHRFMDHEVGRDHWRKHDAAREYLEKPFNRWPQACKLGAAQLLVHSAARKMARGARALKEVLAAKVFATKTLFDIASNGMHALGRYAQLPDYDMERYFREAKHGMVGGGSIKIQRSSLIVKEKGL